MRVDCPICATNATLFQEVSGVAYFDCADCDFIFAEPALLARMDRGEAIRKYDSAYWDMELPAARDRSFGPALARVAETLLYARLPVSRFLDVGTGAGALLDALRIYLPRSSHVFHGIELFPPPEQFQSRHPNYHKGQLSQLAAPFQAGCCIEVIEHLTPKMLSSLAGDLANISDPNALFLFNTGLTAYVKKEAPDYLCPIKRGHICIWSVKAAARIFGPLGFTIMPILGKTWAFVAEYQSAGDKEADIRDRIWTPHPDNRKLLNDSDMGSLLYVAGIDAARAYP